MSEAFGPYQVLELLGRGGMGEVHRARDTVNDRIVALKRLPVRLGADEEFERRFRAECAVVAALDHPHIVGVHAYGEIDGRLYLAMHLVDGPDLGALLTREAGLAPARAVDLVEQVAEALDAAHAVGMVHRDVKPANVLVARREGRDLAYVADFGLARAVSSGSTSLTSTGTAVGSMAYMAPERFTGGHGDHRADIYALGCLLFECVAGRPPFVCDGLPAMVHAHLNVEPPRVSAYASDVPSGLDAVIARGMAKDPELRYASAGDLAADARAALDGRPPAARQQARAVAAMVRRRRPRPSVLVPLSAAGVLALLGCTVLVLEAGSASARTTSASVSTSAATPPTTTIAPTTHPTTGPDLDPYPSRDVVAPELSGGGGSGGSGGTSPSPRTEIPPTTSTLSSTTISPPPAERPRIVGTSTRQDGDLVYLAVRYQDADGDADGFGFRGARGSGWAEETHPFSSPSYGRVSNGQIEYPFNHGCTNTPVETDIEFWIYDSRGRGDSTTVHLACS
jgi:serine/threonine kinase PknH